ncbi:bifunctional Peptidase C19 [Babesia duncani]|uniref:ubiquitinyl hydrolase 1 n=1 Tax=Babesia duncani TaxID=323732 RepID=A0AAD9PLK7_9APIC|nr:bifunctional Peptidase C19 [Babesia duncani]
MKLPNRKLKKIVIELHNKSLDFIKDENIQNEVTDAHKTGSCKQKQAPENTSAETLSNSIKLLLRGNVVGVDYLPVSPYESQSNRMAGGLHNPGINVCFMNVIVQVLTHSPYFACALIRGGHSKICSNHSKGLICTLCTLEAHVKKAIGCKSALKNPFVSVASMLVFKRFQIGRQEDAYIFLKHFLEALIKCCYPNKYGHLMNIKPTQKVQEDFMQSVVGRVLGGHLLNLVQCDYCKYTSKVLEPFFDIAVDIQCSNKLEDLLRRFVSRERLDGNNKYHCPRCKSHQRATKSACIYRMPRILNIALKRFGVRATGCEKSPKKIHYPSTLSVSMNTNDDPSKTIWLTYDLYAIVCHVGKSLNMGHYLAYIKGSHGFWNCYDDSNVRNVSQMHVLGQRSQVYLLFYGVRADDIKYCGKLLHNPSIPNGFNSNGSDISESPDRNISNHKGNGELQTETDSFTHRTSEVDVDKISPKGLKILDDDEYELSTKASGSAIEGSVPNPKHVVNKSDLYIDINGNWYIKKSIKLRNRNAVSPNIHVMKSGKLLYRVNDDLYVDGDCNLYLNKDLINYHNNCLKGYSPIYQSTVPTQKGEFNDHKLKVNVINLKHPSKTQKTMIKSNVKRGSFTVIVQLDSSGIRLNELGYVQLNCGLIEFMANEPVLDHGNGIENVKSSPHAQVNISLNSALQNENLCFSGENDKGGILPDTVKFCKMESLYVDPYGNIYTDYLSGKFSNSITIKGLPHISYPRISRWYPFHKLGCIQVLSRFYNRRSKLKTPNDVLLTKINDIGRCWTIAGCLARYQKHVKKKLHINSNTTYTIQEHTNAIQNSWDENIEPFDIEQRPRIAKWSDAESISSLEDQLMPRFPKRSTDDIEYDRGKLKKKKRLKRTHYSKDSQMVLGKEAFDRLSHTK